MEKRLKTRPYPKKENRLQVKLNGRWRSHKDFTATCWSWAGVSGLATAGLFTVI